MTLKKSLPPVEQPKEPLILTGTAISGDEIDGRRIVDITPDFVTLDDGERIFLQKGLN